MSRAKLCWECWAPNGAHYPHCQSRGYAAVGPHPDAPAREPASPAPAGVEQEMCCGGTCVRSACDYHRDQGPPAFEYGSFDCATAQLYVPPVAWIDIPGCNCGRCR